MHTPAVMHTADEVATSAGAYARFIQDAGCVPGDRFAIIVEQDTPEGALRTVAAAWGALSIGVIPVMVNGALPDAQQDAICQNAQPIGILHSSAPPPPDARAASVAVPHGRPMHYTSGTTGTPKGVWSGVLTPHDATALWGEERDLWGFAEDDRHLIHGLLSHSAPLRFALGTVLAGGSIISVGAFDVASVESVVESFGPTTAFVVPTHLRRLRGTEIASTYRLLVHAGESCPNDVRRWVHEWAGCDVVWEFYGSTEGQFTAMSAQEYSAHAGSVGRARANRMLRVRDDVIWCRVPTYARWEYWRDPSATNAAWHHDDDGSWFSVGDCGVLDADGYLTLTGRKDDLIITGGINVSPLLVESTLEHIPGVEDVVVFGVADEDWGQRVCAAYVGDLTEVQLAAAAKERLAPHQRPKDFYRVPVVQRNPNGKRIRSISAFHQYLP